MKGILYIFFFLVGASIGSFLNVVIYRLPRKKPFFAFGERSYCPYCKKTLKVADLVPIFSFLFLRGKCRHCKKHISWQYIIIESIVGLIFAASFWAFGASLEFVYAIVLFSFAVPIIVIDARHKVIPDALSIPLIVVTAVIGFLTLSWQSVLIGGALGGTFFFLQWFLSKGRWVGSGDIRIGFVMGLLLGWEMFLASIVVSYLLGTVVSLVLLATRKKKLSSTVAFGPFLLIGMLIIYFWGQPLIDWYFTTYWFFDTSYI